MRTQTRPVAKGTRDPRFPEQLQTVIRFEDELFAEVRARAIRDDTSWQIFKAALAAGEEWAVTARDIAAEGGCRLMTGNRTTEQKKPGEIYGIRMFRDVVEHHKREDIVTALQVLMRTEGYCDTQDFWNAGFLRPVLEALCKRPAAMAREGFADKFSEMDLWTFEAEIAAANRERQRQGLGSMPVFEQLYVRVLAWIDGEFAEQAALPAPGRAV